MPPWTRVDFSNPADCDQQRSCVRPLITALIVPLAGMVMCGLAPEQNCDFEALCTRLGREAASPSRIASISHSAIKFTEGDDGGTENHFRVGRRPKYLFPGLTLDTV